MSFPVWGTGGSKGKQSGQIQLDRTQLIRSQKTDSSVSFFTALTPGDKPGVWKGHCNAAINLESAILLLIVVQQEKKINAGSNGSQVCNTTHLSCLSSVGAFVLRPLLLRNCGTQISANIGFGSILAHRPALRLINFPDWQMTTSVFSLCTAWVLRSLNCMSWSKLQCMLNGKLSTFQARIVYRPIVYYCTVFFPIYLYLYPM